MNTQEYFKNLKEDVDKIYSLAEKAKKTKLDPVDYVEIPLAMTMAEKVVGLISTIYPQMKDSGVAKRITELEKEYGKLDPTVIFNSSCVYIGRTDSLKAIAMVRFQYIPDSLTYLTTDKISECYMELYPNEYAIGDTIGNNLSFNVYRVKKYWTAKTVCDSLFDETGNSDYFDVVSQGSYSKPIPYGDTVGPIRIDLNKQMLLDWFVMARDSVINWGIAMISDENTNVIRQFSAQAITEDLKGAELTMYYTNDKGEKDTLKLTAGIEASVVCIKQPATDNMVIQGEIINKGKIERRFKSNCWHTINFVVIII